MPGPAVGDRGELVRCERRSLGRLEQQDLSCGRRQRAEFQPQRLGVLRHANRCPRGPGEHHQPRSAGHLAEQPAQDTDRSLVGELHILHGEHPGAAEDGPHQVRHGLLEARPAEGVCQLGDLGSRRQLRANHSGQQRQPLLQLRRLAGYGRCERGCHGLRLGLGRHAEQVP